MAPSAKGKGCSPDAAQGSAKRSLTEEERAAAEAKQRSFERSLAGPSVGKAGLMRDQTEVNRIIAEASKGSKFYSNQVRKDKELNEKIEWFQAKRDELMKMANRARLEADADRILLEVESERDLSQFIVHVDMDAFYASVEELLDPSLHGKPFAVGGGVLTTASYEARKFGCRSGMAEFVAKKLCPQLIIVSNNFENYISASKAVREVLIQYDPNLAMASLDEGYLNITPYMNEHNMTATEVITQLRAEVEMRTKLTISAGIAPNRMLAKICSDVKKPNGQYEMEFERAAITRFMRDLPVRKIPGFGRVTERCLEGLGVETCGQIYEKRAELLVMDHWFGFRGLCKAYLGISENTVAPGKREERKSVGVERTFRDKTDPDDIMEMLVEIAEELHKDLDSLQYAGKTVTVKYKLHTFENKTRAQSVRKYISTKDEILPIAQELLRKELPLRIRLLGIRLSTLKDLTIPDKGIRSFFSSPKKKGQSKDSEGSRSGSPHPADRDVIDLAQMDEDDADIELIEDDFKPVSNPAAATTSTSGQGKRKVNMDEHVLGPVCPICSKRLGVGTSNQDLNDHIDLCLNKDAISQASKRTPKKAKREHVDGVGDTNRGGGGGDLKRGSKVESRGTMMSWLSRS